MSTTVYIAGPMRGIAEFNFPEFFSTDTALRTRGYVTVNPASRDLRSGFEPYGMTGDEDLAALGFDLREALAWDMHKIATDCDAVCVLPGWEKSSGARAEVALAHALGLYVGWLDGFSAEGLDPTRMILPTTPSSGTLKENPTPKLFGFGGLLASGKDAAADYLVEHHGFVKLNMSEPLHEAMLALDPFIPVNAHETLGFVHGAFLRYSELVKEAGYTDAKKNPEVRRLLQQLGTEVGRKMIDEDVWVDIAGRKIDALYAEGKSVVITGIRFPNELGLITKRGGKTVWVDRGSKPADGAHASENSIGEADFNLTLNNFDTLETLYAATRELAEVTA